MCVRRALSHEFSAVSFSTHAHKHTLVTFPHCFTHSIHLTMSHSASNTKTVCSFLNLILNGIQFSCCCCCSLTLHSATTLCGSLWRKKNFSLLLILNGFFCRIQLHSREQCPKQMNEHELSSLPEHFCSRSELIHRKLQRFSQGFTDVNQKKRMNEKKVR